ncbi:MULTISPECIES: PaaX family transcriptional regulator C-terminal domain-containing protein [Roseobacteraceae]|uniref:Transcriptional repressor PaaX n=1 Tax=Pseudosulfitobacter pseudonitzschiae TaxID=1402135 RepID=A0A221K4D7_9RHOB|nr:MULTISPECIES: PaaX family transcriptional regulator C-terminal domain-containing protein [Roseobacteraceae]ASM73859.1 transcriptional repressor PaaX [Pseudosulfitobacter pseudonitzschiae]
MPSDPYANALDILTATATQRVWSVLVSVFGDLARHEGEGIDGPVLTALMAEAQIKPEATRVALHRLRNDDWITSVKSGRTSHHSLTRTGRRLSLAASARIYSTPEETAQGWQLVLLETATSESREDMETLGFALLAPRLYIGADNLMAPDGALALPADTAPRWLGAQFEPKDLSQDYAALHERLMAIDALKLDAAALSPVQIGVLRSLIVHGWRRLVLKHPDLPRDVYSDAWRGHDCRALVTGLLARLPRPALNDLHD